MNIFEILKIKPSNDFKLVKKAYLRQALLLHPDKWVNASEEVRIEKEAAFKTLNSAFELVNTKELLDQYLSGSRLPQSQSNLFNTPPQSNEQDQSLSEALTQYPKGTTEVYIAVPYHKSGNNSANKFKLPENNKNFTSKFDFEQIKNILNEMFSNTSRQVGVTFDEAVEIVNQHSHRELIMIVKVQTPLSRLDEKSSEKKRYGPNILNAADGDYFWLAQNTTFNSADIIEIKPMLLDDYKHSRKHPGIFDVNTFWPAGLTLENPKAKKELQAAKPLAPIEYNLEESEQHEPLQTISLNEFKEKLLPRLIANNPSLKFLYDAIDAMSIYGSGMPSEKGRMVVQHASELKNKLTEFLHSPQVSEQTFKKEFKAFLHTKDEQMQAHRQEWKPILANILLALTGVGLVAIFAKFSFHIIDTLVSRKKLNINQSFFFGETKTERMVKSIDEAAENLKKDGPA